VLFTVTVGTAVLAWIHTRAFGRVQALVSDAAETLVLPLANAFVVEMPAIALTHLYFSMCSARAFS
jgi:hypothetical protein